MNDSDPQTSNLKSNDSIGSVSISVKALIRRGEERSQVLLLKRSETSKNHPAHWDLPGGKVDGGEDPVAALTREIKEETGLDIVVTEFVDATLHQFNDRNILYLLFEAKTDHPNVHVQLSNEHSDAQWFDRKELENLQIPTGQKKLLFTITS